MKLPIKTLDLHFRRMPPESILDAMLSGDLKKLHERYETLFSQLAETTLHGYSSDEQNNIFQYDYQKYRKYTEMEYLPPLYLLEEFARGVLESGQMHPVCKYEEVLNWRDAYLLLGQDIFTTAWLTQQKFFREIRFSWPATIPTNNSILNRTLQDLAENHLHLYAGASTFALSWACLMNYPQSILDLEKSGKTDPEDLLDMRFSRRMAGSRWTMKRFCLYAAQIRILLFERLHGLNKNIFEGLRRFHGLYITEEYNVIGIKDAAVRLRYVYGVPFSQPDGRKVSLDYAFSQSLWSEEEEHSRLLAGERYLLYQCFQRCFSSEPDGFSPREQWVFYLYLLLKSNIRRELIQANRQVGFQNFSDYDHRKYALWENRKEYWNEDYRQALNAAFEEQKISSLEGRVSPKATGLKDLQTVHQLDQAKRYYETKNAGRRYELTRWKGNWLTEKLDGIEPHYYVFHFPKRKDRKLPSLGCPCRHEEYRKEVRKKALALAEALSNSAYLCQRVRGIDACSSEIGCRPEVFAPAFRFLRAFPPEQLRFVHLSSEIPHLSVTYHVGEDFLDIADGLRAMDEAIYFLNLRRGDRFGHALALGVDPKRHYDTKHQEIVLPKQDLLDNLVWVCFRSEELSLTMPGELKRILLRRAQDLFVELYDTRNNCTLEDYYHSILLRGDDPKCYGIDRHFHRLEPHTMFEPFCNNDREDILPLLRFYRKQDTLCSLYFRYHYDRGVRKRGEEITSFSIHPDYVTLMREMQTAMCRRINDLGISIECNPTSNVLIGTFQEYQHHPVFRFNNEYLHLPPAEVQMHVSINSDDPGVFDTTLSFEYALLSRTLSEIKDEQGRRKHTDREIEAYIRNLIRMGREQSFQSF